MFAVFLVLLFGLMVFSIDAEGEGEYIFGEFIGSGECGDVAGYELAESFVDGRGLAFNHCVSRKEYVEDLSFVVESYFFKVEDSPNCPRGEQEGFIKDVNNELVLFCVVKGEVDFVEDVSIGEECENGFEGGERILVEGGEIVHCQKGGVLSEDEEDIDGGVGGDGEDVERIANGLSSNLDGSIEGIESCSQFTNERDCLAQQGCSSRRSGGSGCERFTGCEGEFVVEERVLVTVNLEDRHEGDGLHSLEINTNSNNLIIWLIPPREGFSWFLSEVGANTRKSHDEPEFFSNSRLVFYKAQYGEFQNLGWDERGKKIDPVVVYPSGEKNGIYETVQYQIDEDNNEGWEMNCYVAFKISGDVEVEEVQCEMDN